MMPSNLFMATLYNRFRTHFTSSQAAIACKKQRLYKNETMADVEKVPFEIAGEIPEDRLGEMVDYLGALGVQVRSGTELDPVSPSILIEYLKGVNGLPVPAVTERTVEEFLLSEGGHEHGSKTNAFTFMRTLGWHTDHMHAVERVALRRGSIVNFNYFGRVCDGCDCPLRTVVYVSHGEEFIGGLDPQSLIKFSELPFQEAKEKIDTGGQDFRRLGRKRYALTQKIAQRLREDLEVA